MTSLKGKKLGIVGTSGLAQVLVLEAAKHGAELLLFDRHPLSDRLSDHLAGELKCKFEHHILDVSDLDSIEECVQSACAAKRLDGFVYMPRAREVRDFQSTTPATWKKDLDVSAGGAFFCVQAALPFLQPEAGVVFVSSVLSTLVGPESVGYHAAKAALEQVGRYLAVQLGEKRIRVNTVRLGVAAKSSPFEADSSELQEFKSKLGKFHPLGNIGEPEDLSSAILFLLSPESKFITGQVLCLDGGLTIQEPIHLSAKFR